MKKQNHTTRYSWIQRGILISVAVTILGGCGAKESGIALSPKDWKVREAEPLASLAEYYAKYSSLPKRADLIACAAGGQMAMGGEGKEPVSVFFYPMDDKWDVTDIRIFEAESIETDTLNFASFQEKRWPAEPVFNGYLRRYATGYKARETWMVITCLTNDTLHTSGMIHLRVDTQPTVVDMSGITLTEDTSGLRFNWPGAISSGDTDSASPVDAIYFEVVSDGSMNLISGTYTREPDFTFYDTRNVVINIHDTDPSPTLDSGQDYEFMVMAVSRDNWVNRILKRRFVAPKRDQ